MSCRFPADRFSRLFRHEVRRLRPRNRDCAEFGEGRRGWWWAPRSFSDMIRRDGPPRMVARSTWSGRERSSHSRFLPVPRVGLVTFAFLRSCCSSFFASPGFSPRSSVVHPFVLSLVLNFSTFGFRPVC